MWFYKLFRPINAVAAWALGVFGMVNAVAILASTAAVATALDVAARRRTRPRQRCRGDDAAALPP